ncbi:hypothetical protein EON81_05085 [bacterium]|nr:MAG: hypothetical protein EON81_05085 [bacterium]
MVVALAVALVLNRPVTRDQAAVRSVHAVVHGDIDSLCQMATGEEKASFCGERKGELGGWLRQSFQSWRKSGQPVTTAMPGDAMDEATLALRDAQGQTVHIRALVRAERGQYFGVGTITGAIMSAVMARRPMRAEETSTEGLYQALVASRSDLERIGVDRFPAPQGDESWGWDQMLARQSERVRIRTERESKARQAGRL